MAFAYNHYETYGWHRDGIHNAWFDVKGYLDAYPDVKAAGMDPLLFHYDTFGWKEGRDPSASFDTNVYANIYGDVKAAGVNPFICIIVEDGALRDVLRLGWPVRADRLELHPL